MKHLFYTLLFIMACASGPLYREMPDGKGFEVLHPEFGKLQVYYGVYFESPPDTIRFTPSLHAVFGANPDITIIPWNPRQPNPFGPATTLNIINLNPDTMSVVLIDETENVEIQAYKGLIGRGAYRLFIEVHDYAPHDLDIVKLSVGNDTRFFKKYRTRPYEEIRKEQK